MDYLVGSGKAYFGYYYTSDMLNRRLNDVMHCVSVMALPDAGLLLGYVEYFSVLRVVICLSDHYTGKELSNTYALDPRTGESLDVHVDLKLQRRDIENIYNYTHYCPSVLERCFADISRIAYGRSFELRMRKELANAHAKAIDELNIDNDQDLADCEYELYPARVMALVMPFFEREIARERFLAGNAES